MSLLKTHRIISKILIYYLLIFLIPLTVIIYVYIDVYKSTLNRAYDNQLSQLEKSSTILNFNFTAIEDLAYQINANQYVNQFLHSGTPSKDNSVIADIYNLQPIIASYLTTNNYIKEIQIYSQKAQSMITSKTSYVNLYTVYEDNFSNKFKTYRKFSLEYLNKSYKPNYVYNQNVGIGSQSSNYLTYMQSLTRSKKDNIANMFIYLDQDRLLDVLENEGAIETGFAIICDKNGNVISRGNTFDIDDYHEIIEKCTNPKGYFTKKINEKNMLVTYEKAEKFDGYYITGVSEDNILGSIHNIKILFITIVSITTAVGALLIVLFAYKTSNPIISLVELLEKNKIVDKVSYSDKFINGEVLKIIQSNTSLREKVVDQIPAMKIALLYKLLNGSATDMDELVGECGQMGIKIQGKYYAVLIISMVDVDINSKIDEISAYKVLLNEYIHKNMDEIIGIYDMSVEDEAIILSTQLNNYVDLIAQLESIAIKICKYTQRQLGISIMLSGSVTDKVESIYKCYNEAKNAKQYTENINNMNIIWYNKSKRIDTGFIFYPINIEIEIIQGIAQGNVEVCKKILCDVQKNNFKNGYIDLTMGQQLLNALSATIYRSVIENNNLSAQLHEKIDHINEYIVKTQDINVAYSYISDIIYQMCNSIDNGTANNNLATSVEEYVHQNYNNNQLSLTLVAENFKITEIYLSRFFKEKTGENFSKYVEKLRMCKAKDLLINTDYKIKFIAEKVGYNSPQVFRRVYKKYYGELPSKRSEE